MKRIAASALLLLAACSWSNALYQARSLSREATQAERDQQPGLAAQLWGSVLTEADSAYRHNPDGVRGAEALWLAGHAAARMHDCTRAVTSLQGALAAAVHRPWEEQLLIDLGNCQEALGSPAAASIYESLVASSRDSVVRRDALIHQGHAAIAAGNWDLALRALAGIDDPGARLDRATALAHLDESSRAVAELGPFVRAADLSVRWEEYLDLIAAHDPAVADSLLQRVVALPSVQVERRAELRVTAARAAADRDPAMASRWLSQIDPGKGRAASDGAALRQELRLTQTSTPSQLRAAVDSVEREMPEPHDSRTENLLRFSRFLVHANDSLAGGAPRGDLAVFVLAEVARDSLHAPRVAIWYLARLEHDWPRSAYVGKALIARALLQPDSAASIGARAAALSGNAYAPTSYGSGAARIRLPQLEDSLTRFTYSFRVPASTSTVAPDHP